MTDRHTAPFPRRALEAMTRRTSLLTLGGVALAAIIPDVSLVEAKKKGKNARKRNRKKNDANDRCEQQGPACRGFAGQFCAAFHPPSPIRDVCSNRATACCASIEACDGGEYFSCLSEHVEDLAPN